MLKQMISGLVRSVGLINVADVIRFRLMQIANVRQNLAFKKQYPLVTLPPEYLMYEAYRMNYYKYYFGGKATAEWIKGHLKKYLDLQNSTILEWGCGPGRIVRHLPEVINNGCRFHGTDYNKQSIDWCKIHLDGIDFSENYLEAKLPYDSDYFDAIYGISVFTHLSEKSHFEWCRELFRVLRKGGILFLTTQGKCFEQKLTTRERRRFDHGQLVVRQKAKEGHRTYSAFQPTSFMRQLFNSNDILEHIEGEIDAQSRLVQDIWIVRKK